MEGGQGEDVTLSKIGIGYNETKNHFYSFSQVSFFHLSFMNSKLSAKNEEDRTFHPKYRYFFLP